MACEAVAGDLISYNTSISACEKAAQWEMALILLRRWCKYCYSSYYYYH